LAARCALIVTGIGALGILLVWNLANASGQLGRFESFMRSIGFRHFHIASSQVLLGTVLLVAGVALTLATFVVLAGAAYNLLAASGGGLRLRIAVDPLGADARVAAATGDATEPPAAHEIEPAFELPAVGRGYAGPVPEPA
jgi:hypothetical protein